MNIGIMGGTFDPIHLGHLLAAEQALTEAGLDEVWFMPARVPPHKQREPAAGPAHRMAMVEMAVEDHPRFRVKDLEMSRDATSYTADTVILLKERYPRHRFAWIIGADMVLYLPNWHRIADIAAEIGFIGLARPGFELDLGELPEAIRRKVRLVPMPHLELSSTDIRERRSRGRSVRYMVPEPVRKYMEENGLYEP